MHHLSGTPQFRSRSFVSVTIKDNSWRDRTFGGDVKVSRVKANPGAALPRAARIARLRATVTTR